MEPGDSHRAQADDAVLPQSSQGLEPIRVRLELAILELW
jgi:hypothetical protein